MIARWGEPEKIRSTGPLLERLGATGVDPDDVVAFLYAGRAAAEAWHASNLEHYGHPSLGFLDASDGQVIGVLDLRPAIHEARMRQRRERA